MAWYDVDPWGVLGGDDDGGGGSNLGELIGGPWGQFLGMLIGSGAQAEAQEEAGQKTDEQIEQALRTARWRQFYGPELYKREMGPAVEELEGLQERTTRGARNLAGQTIRQGFWHRQDFERRADELMGGYRGEQADFLEQLGGREQNILSGYGGRYTYAQDQLSQLGGQQRADINRQFDEEQARVTLDLQQRGLLSSTEAARGGYDVAERRSAELRRFEEDLTRERIGTLSALSGEQLGAQERLGGQRAGYQFAGQQAGFQQQAGLDAAQAAYERAIRGDVLGAQQNVLNYDMQTSGALADLYGGRASNMANLYMQGSGDYLNTLMGINYQPPAQSNLGFMFGQNAVQPVQGPSSWETMMPGLISAGGDMAGALMLMQAIGGSDRNMKEDIRSFDERRALGALSQLPVRRWRYKGDALEHVGPMAQDFHKAFAVGTDRTIHLVDVAGVLIASVQALYAEVRQLRQEIKQEAVGS